jgi:hypothetical protein
MFQVSDVSANPVGAPANGGLNDPPWLGVSREPRCGLLPVGPPPPQAGPSGGAVNVLGQRAIFDITAVTAIAEPWLLWKYTAQETLLVVRAWSAS